MRSVPQSAFAVRAFKRPAGGVDKELMRREVFPCSRDERRDGGFTVVELIVAMVIFATMMSGLAYGFMQTIGLNRGARETEVASNLAAQALDEARATTDFANLSGGEWTETVNGATFTLLRTVTPQASDGAESLCDGVPNAQSFFLYKRISVKVTWPTMGSVPPVRADTLLTPGVGAYDPIKGNVAIRVVGASGNPREGVAVVLESGAAQYTDDHGCAFFDGLESGVIGVTATRAGMVDPQGESSPTQVASVENSATTTIAFELDSAGALSVSLGSAEYPAPDGVPVTIANPSILPQGTRRLDGLGASRELANLYPFASGYNVWAGGCSDADPLGQTTEGEPYHPAASSRGEPVSINSSSSLTMAQVDLSVVDGAGDPVPGVSVSASHSNPVEAMCLGALVEDYELGVTDGSGLVRASLPWGSWQFASSGSTRDATLEPSDPLGASNPTSIVLGGDS